MKRITDRFWLSPAKAADVLAPWARDGNPDNDIDDDLILAISMAMVLPTDVEEWHGIWLGGIDPSKRLFIAASLDDPKMPKLTQADFNFLTLADVPDREMAISRKRTDNTNSFVKTMIAFHDGKATAEELKRAAWKDLADIEPEVKRFCEAFAKQALCEAAESKYRIFGQYEMDKVPLPYLDSMISYDNLRLVFYQDGIRGSIVHKNMYTPFVWSPERQSAWMFGAKIAWALHMLMAGIWRDACVVQEKFYTERTRKVYQPRRRESRDTKRMTVLPRVVRHILWSDDSEREKITHRAHTVKGFFRHLPDGWKTGEDAAKAALNEQGLEPPEGWTYVRPHQRGGKEQAEEDVQPRKIICRGLQAARIALNFNPDDSKEQ